MSEPDTTRWTFLGQSCNSRYFEIEAGLLAAVPQVGARDDLASARDNLAFQHAYWRRHGRPGAAVVFFDNMVSQNKDARHVYASESDAALMLGTALVGGTMLSRAMGSFFLGLTRPRTPVKMFKDTGAALGWCRGLLAGAAQQVAR